jgi:hypothetical protein
MGMRGNNNQGDVSNKRKKKKEEKMPFTHEVSSKFQYPNIRHKRIYDDNQPSSKFNNQ